jgi:tetratricopeptide (TPR) repeat protein
VALSAQSVADLQTLFGLYDGGEYDLFDQHRAAVARSTSVEAFEREAQRWISGSQEFARRRLVTASVALELADAQRASWKTGQPRRLLEYGCELLRQQKPNSPERAWQLATLTLAGSVGDYYFLLDVPPLGPRGKVGVQIAVGHAGHAAQRFPNEPAVLLAAAVALEQQSLAHAVDYSRELSLLVARLRELVPIPEIAAEAHLRLGLTYRRLARLELALLEYQQAERIATTPFVEYLARFLGGQLLEQSGRAAEAALAYRSALGSAPRAQSASFALASLLFQGNRRDEALALVGGALSRPLATDPLKLYKAGDPAHWQRYLTELRQGLR